MKKAKEKSRTHKSEHPYVGKDSNRGSDAKQNKGTKSSRSGETKHSEIDAELKPELAKKLKSTKRSFESQSAQSRHFESESQYYFIG
jgi:hypothetical protein